MDQPAQPTSLAKKIPIQYGAEPNTIIFRGEDGVEQTIKLPTGSLPVAALNNMEYEDNNGVKHSIYLPQGTVHAAWDHLENERWDELAKFAPFRELLLPQRGPALYTANNFFSGPRLY